MLEIPDYCELTGYLGRFITLMVFLLGFLTTRYISSKQSLIDNQKKPRKSQNEDYQTREMIESEKSFFSDGSSYYK